MIRIAHRGNFNGKNLDKENNPKYLYDAVSRGYEVEADFWLINNQIFLGHDFPQYKIDKFFIENVKDVLWAHCKNIEMCRYFFESDINYFWHQNDDCTITSKGFIWTLPEFLITDKTVVVDLENKYQYQNIFGICSDYFE